MEWEFTRELQDQIIYSMENQEKSFFLDIRTGTLLPEDRINGTEVGTRFHLLPQWRSLEGFQLMERFVASVRNPLFREELRAAISTGKGVFRSFKNSLKKRKELERLWFSFKEQEMRGIVFEWFNRILESEGLEKLTPPAEDTEELVFSDFNITSEIRNYAERISDLDRRVFLEGFSTMNKEAVLEHYETVRKSLPPLESDESFVLIAETPARDFAGFVWAVEREDPPHENPIVDLVQMAIVNEYQGLGLGQALLKKLIEVASATGAERIRVHLEGRFLDAAKLFELRGFDTSSQTMDLDLSKWESEKS
jgi:GNAT superfamily N-acetyltransferase